MSAQEPDEFDLELLEAGAPTHPDLARELTTNPTLAPARDEIAAMRAWWTAHRPPLPAEEAPRARPLARWMPWAGGAALVAAALLAVTLQPSGDRAPGFQARGEPSVDVARSRDGDPVRTDAAYAPGDVLTVSLVVDEPGYVSVYTVQEDGAVSVLAAGIPAEPTTAFHLPGISLDAYDGREWLVVEETDHPRTAALVADEGSGLLPQPAAADGRWTLEVTRGGAR